ncbi:hypothetical protein ACP4OV_021144 [Aristida adscensionis]
MPLTDVAAMVRETITAPVSDEHFQELVDWEEHKAGRYIDTAILGLGCPTVSVSAFSSFPIDSDFSFGRAALVTPMTTSAARLCAGFVQITAQPAVGEPWIVNAFVWPRLAAALEADEARVFKPVTAEHLGLLAPRVQLSRL